MNDELKKLLEDIKDWMITNDYECGPEGADIFDRIQNVLKTKFIYTPTKKAKKEPRWMFRSDDSGHWYRIREADVKKFDNLLARAEDEDGCGSATVEFEKIFGKCRTGRSPEAFTFLDPN